MNTGLSRYIPKHKDSYEFVEFFGSRSRSTVKSYCKDIKILSDWLDQNNYADDLPIPTDTILDWVKFMTAQKIKPNTIKRRICAVSFLHQINGLEKENPAYDSELRGITRKIKQIRSLNGLSNKVQQKTPLTSNLIKSLVKCCSKKTKSGIRDRALILTAFSTAARRSEVCNLQWNDIDFESDNSGARITIAKSKTDKLSEGQTIYINKGTKYFCPIKALISLRDISRNKEGYVFTNMKEENKPISGDWFAKIIKQKCKEAGLDQSLFSGHSTRRGLLVSASDRGDNLHILAAHARHKNSLETEHYIGGSISHRNNPTKGILR